MSDGDDVIILWGERFTPASIKLLVSYIHNLGLYLINWEESKTNDTKYGV